VEQAVSAIREVCSVCAKPFDVVFRYQMEERDGGFAFFCSQGCLGRSHGSSEDGQSPIVTCDGCYKRFPLKLASQALYTGGKRKYACSMACRSQLVREASGLRLGELATEAGEPVAPETAGAMADRSGAEQSAALSPLAGAAEPWPSPADGVSPSACEPAPLASIPILQGQSLADDAPDSSDRLPETLEEEFGELGAQAKPGVVMRANAKRGDRLGAAGKLKKASLSAAPVKLWPPKRIAVFNHKGGTGKTTTSVNLAAGLADRGKRVLLVDTDSQGNVAVSLGVTGERSLYHVLVMGLRVQDAVRTVRPNLDVLPSNETLAAAELYLAGRQQRDRVLAQRMDAAAAEYDYVVIDCSPSLSLMNQNALVFADSVLVPVACDYLSLVGVRQVIKTVRHVNALLHHRLQIWGVVPTFYDMRAKICTEALDTLRDHFGERCLEPIRATTRLKEAPAQAQSIFEYAPGTRGADDYLVLVDRVLGTPAQAEAGREPPGRPLADGQDGTPARAHAVGA